MPTSNSAEHPPRRRAAVGVAEHVNTAVLVTVGPGGELLDRRCIDRTDPACRRTLITTKGPGPSAVI